MVSEAECRVAKMEESFKKQIRDLEERASARGLQLERRLREEEELAQRISTRNADLQVVLCACGGQSRCSSVKD